MSKSKVKKRAKVSASKRRRGRGKMTNGLHKPEPRTEQKTVRVPKHIVRALEQDVLLVESLTVPKAIVQILEEWHARRMGAVAS